MAGNIGWIFVCHDVGRVSCRDGFVEDGWWPTRWKRLDLIRWKRLNTRLCQSMSQSRGINCTSSSIPLQKSRLLFQRDAPVHVDVKAFGGPAVVHALPMGDSSHLANAELGTSYVGKAFQSAIKGFNFPERLPFEPLSVESPSFNTTKQFTCTLNTSSTQCGNDNDPRNSFHTRCNFYKTFHQHSQLWLNMPTRVCT